MIFLRPTITIFFCLLTAGLIAQDEGYENPDRCKERSGLEYGVTAGIYMAGRATADFYSGKPGNENNVDYLFKNTTWRNEINDLLGVYDTSTVINFQYPDKMKYSPAFSFGLFAKYDLDCRNGIYLQFSYARLTAKDIVTVEVNPTDIITEPDIRHLPIFGVEERNIVDLGFTHAFGNNKTARVILGAGISMNNTLVKEHILKVENELEHKTRDFNMVNIYGNNSYVPGANQQTYEIRQGGIGFGIFGTIGARMEFSPAIAIEPGFTFYYKQIAIDPKNGFAPNMNFYLKLCFRDLISFSN